MSLLLCMRPAQHKERARERERPNQNQALRYIQWFYHDTSDLLLFCINIYSQITYKCDLNKSIYLHSLASELTLEQTKKTPRHTNRLVCVCCFRLMLAHFASEFESIKTEREVFYGNPVCMGSVYCWETTKNLTKSKILHDNKPPKQTNCFVFFLVNCLSF